MNKARKIAIAGATGMVGQSFLKLLEKDYFQDSETVSYTHLTLPTKRIV